MVIFCLVVAFATCNQGNVDDYRYSRVIGLSCLLMAVSLSGLAQDRASIPSITNGRQTRFSYRQGLGKRHAAIRTDLDKLAAYRGKFAGKEATNPAQSHRVQ